MTSPLRHALSRRISIGALIELALWLAIPYLTIGFVWAALHHEAVDRIETRLQALQSGVPTGSDLEAFGLVAALWPVSLQLADACPAP